MLDLMDHISFNGLLKLMVDNEMNKGDLCSKLNIGYESLAHYLKGFSSVRTNFLAKCMYLFNVPASSIVEFNDIEMNEARQIDYIKTVPAFVYDFFPLVQTVLKTDEVSRENLNRIFDCVDTFELTERQDFALWCSEQSRLMPAVTHKKHYGLSDSHRYKLYKNEPIDIRVLYNICKVSHCNLDDIFHLVYIPSEVSLTELPSLYDKQRVLPVERL